MLIQQGDILLNQVLELPKDSIEIKSNVLHLGDNHKHTVSGDFKLFSCGQDIYLSTDSKCVLEHDEHGLSDEKFRTVEKGIYKKSIVLEYDHMLEESRLVID